MIKKLYRIFYDFGKQLQRDNISAYASSTAFFFFLSVAPMLLVACAIITYTPITEEILATTVTGFLPDEFDYIAVRFIDQMYNKAHAIIPFAVVVAVWSAGKGMMGLQMGLNRAHGVIETRNYVIIRLQASLYMLITLVAIILSLVLSILTKNMAAFIGKIFPASENLFRFFSNYRFLFGWIILTFLFALIYTFIPNIKLRFKYQLPGAAICAVGWQLYTYGLSLYIQYFGGFSMYGSLSTLIVVLFWLYFSMTLLLLGANLNRYFKPVIKVLFNIKRLIKGEEKIN